MMPYKKPPSRPPRLTDQPPSSWRDKLSPELVQELEAIFVESTLRELFEAFRNVHDLGPAPRQKARILVNRGLRPCGVMFHDPASDEYAGITAHGKVLWFTGKAEE